MSGKRDVWLYALGFIVCIARPLFADQEETLVPSFAPALVRVLNTEGRVIAGVEVILHVTRRDGIVDRRLALTDARGIARFFDIRQDCLELFATVTAGRQQIESRPQKCSLPIEVFIVIPAEPKSASVPSHSEKKTTDRGETKAAKSETRNVERYREKFFIGGALGVNRCAEWFYLPNNALGDVSCSQLDPLGLSVHGRGAIRIVKWLDAGLAIGYRLYRGAPILDRASEGGEENLPAGILPVIDDDIPNKVTYKIFSCGAVLRATYGLGDWFAGVSIEPIGFFGQATVPSYRSGNLGDFYTALGVEATYRFWQSVKAGLMAQFFQPLPWIDKRDFGAYRGLFEVQIVVGARIGKK